MSLAKIILQGRLGRDPELKSLSTGTQVLIFTIAVDTGFGDKKKTSWFNCSVFGKRAESLTNILTKGKEVLIDGKPQMRQYEGKDGTKKSFFEVLVDDLFFTSGGGNKSEPKQEKIESSQDQNNDDFSPDVPF